MFKKKETQLFSLQDIAKVYADFSQSDVFMENGYNNEWLWHQFNLLQFFLLNKETISINEIENILNLKNVENFPPKVNDSYLWLKNEQEKNPVIVSFIPVIITLLSEKDKTTLVGVKFKDYIKSFANILSLGIVAGMAFYFSLFNSFIITLAVFLLGYWSIGKVFKIIKNKRIEKNIEVKIQNIDKAKTTKYNDLLHVLSKINYSHLSKKLVEQLDLLKNQSLRISKGVPDNNIQAWVDVERMWLQHIPSLIVEYENNSHSEEIIFKTIQAMEYVLDKHMEEIFWESNLKITAKEKFWLSKVSKELEIG